MKAQQTLEEIAKGFSIETIGQAFFYSLSNYLSKALRVDYVFIGELVQPEQTVRSLIFLAHGKEVKNVAYPLIGSLCEKVVSAKTLCAFPRNVQQQFPQNQALKRFGVDSYVGIPLQAVSGKVIGLMYVMAQGPIQDLEHAQFLLTIMAKRASLELEREQQERALLAKNKELEQLNGQLRQTQQALEESNQGLEAKVERRTRELLAREEELYHALQKSMALIRTLAEREAFLSSIVNQTSVGIAQTDQAGRFTFANEAYQKIVGRSLDQLLEMTLMEITYPEDLPRNLPLLAQLTQADQWFEIEKRYLRPDGTLVWVLNHVSLVDQAEGQPRHIMAVCQDITQKKQADERLTESQQRYQRLSKQLALANKDLKVANQELRQANQQLSHLNEDLSRANSDLDNFIYTASHDLKAPILNIEGLVNSLLRQLPQENLQGERAGKTVGFIQDSVERFKQTIAHLTDIAKLQHQASQEATLLEVAPLLDAVQLDLAPVIEESKAKLEIDVSECPRIYFSEKNLRSIFYNLLSNAIKYRSPERALLVRISCQQQQGYQVLIVEDNGLGMDMSQEEKIFSMFKRLHDHVEGSGIGLYIVKKMLDNAGGKIEVKKSQVGVGSTFWVYFKLP